MKSNIENLNHAFIEFYEKLSAWELEVIKGKGLSLSLVHAVEILGAFGAMPMKSLADKIGITMGTLTVQVDKMVVAGLVQRVPHQTDRRSILVELTEPGQLMFTEHDHAHLALTKQLTAEFNEDEVKQLMTLLNRINNKF